MQLTAITLLAAAALGGPDSRDNQAPPKGPAVVRHCQIFFINDVDVAAEEAGRLIEVDVKEGDFVRHDDLLARIDDRQAQLQKMAAELERDAALVRANDDIEVRFSIKSFELAEAELNQDLEINKKSVGVIPASEIRRKRLARHRAELQIDRSRLDLKVAQMTANVQAAAVQAAEENILRRQIGAPFDGTVIDVYRQENEWVNAGDPVLRVVRLDQLYVEGFLNGSDYNPSEVADRPVTVEVELARGRREQFHGKVVFVSQAVQAGNRYRIRAEVQNRREDVHWLLRAGMNATLAIHLRPL